MSQKLGRNYILRVQNHNGTTTTIDYSKSPFTLEFDITRNTNSSTNVAAIRVYNLGPKTRDLLRKDITNVGDYRPITLQAGYGANLSTVFTGAVTQAFSVREGTNFISYLESFDGGFAFANSTTETPDFPPETPMKSVIQTITEDLGPTVTLGAIGNSFTGTIGARGNAYNGNTSDLLRDLSNGQFFVDNGKAYFLAGFECVGGSLSVISAETGLLGTPQRQTAIITFDMIFEPRVICGQFVTLKSATDASFNGNYKINAIKHRGTISPVVCGEAITTLELNNSAQALGLIESVVTP